MQIRISCGSLDLKINSGTNVLMIAFICSGIIYILYCFYKYVLYLQGHIYITVKGLYFKYCKLVPTGMHIHIHMLPTVPTPTLYKTDGLSSLSFCIQYRNTDCVTTYSQVPINVGEKKWSGST